MRGPLTAQCSSGPGGGLAWNVLQRIGDIIRCQPDMITLQVGTNDVNATYSASWERRTGDSSASRSHNILHGSWHRISTANSA